jgi:hypothetical protein
MRRGDEKAGAKAAGSNRVPLSPLFHRLPGWAHRLGVLFNHAVEVVAPFGVFGPRRVRLAAGGSIAVFQVMLIASGNLSFLNWPTLMVALACFDDGFLLRLVPGRIPARERLEAWLDTLIGSEGPKTESRMQRFRRRLHVALAVVIGLLSLNPVANLRSRRQAMNSSFDPFQIVNTYGAFGSVSRTRQEVIIEGSASMDPNDERAYREYEFPCKPGAPSRRPRWVTPYHYRLDWQMRFLSFDLDRHPIWFLRLVDKLLLGEPAVLALFAMNPFPHSPPRFVRARV